MEELFRQIKSLGYAAKLDTNGTFPDRLQGLVAQGLVDYVAMDVKNAPASYGATVGLPGFDPAPVLRSAAFLLSGAVEYEFRTTVVDELHTEADFEAIAAGWRGRSATFCRGLWTRATWWARGCTPPQKSGWSGSVRSCCR